MAPSNRDSTAGAHIAMAIAKEKTVVTQRIHGDCPTHSRTEISTRDVKTIIDEPKERDGNKYGPQPDRDIGCRADRMHQRDQPKMREEAWRQFHRHVHRCRIDVRSSRYAADRRDRGAVSKNSA